MEHHKCSYLDTHVLIPSCSFYWIYARGYDEEGNPLQCSSPYPCSYKENHSERSINCPHCGGLILSHPPAKGKGDAGGGGSADGRESHDPPTVPTPEWPVDITEDELKAVVKEVRKRMWERANKH